MVERSLLTAGPALLRRVDHLQRTANPHARTQRLGNFAPVAAAPKLRADPAKGCIWYGDALLFQNLPEAVWRYQLGTRSAVEWVIDQHKDRRPKDLTIREKFDTYRLADHVDEVVVLLGRVIAVSVETMRIVDALAVASPLNPANGQRPVHQAAAPATPPASRQQLLAFSQPAEPVAPPETFTLRLHRGQSDFYLEYDTEEHGTTALKYLLAAFGHEWDARVAAYTVTEYWQGPKQRPGSWIAALVVSPA